MKTGSPNKNPGGPGASAPYPPAPPRKSWMGAARAVLFVRRERWTLTWTGRLLILASLAVVIVILGRGLCGFLAITSPVGGQVVVVEGWMPTFAYREAAALFRKGRYQKIIVAGESNEDEGADLELRERAGGEKLIYFGVPSELVVAVSSGEANRDRTFHSATAVKAWLQNQGLQTASIDVVTVGPHARRSRLLYEKAFGDEMQVGVISIMDRRFDPNHWWRSSAGVRRVIDELIAYLYARILFSRP